MKDKISENGMVYKVVGDYYVTMLFNDLVLTGWLWTYLANLNEQS